MYDIILFDLDGTLTDSSEGITKSVQYALRFFSIDEPNLEKLRCFIGPPMITAFMEYYGFSREKAEQAREKYRERYEVKGIFENKMYEGMDVLLGDLKAAGNTLAVATSKPQKYAEIVLDYFGLSQYFDLIVGAEMHGSIGEKQEIIANAIKLIGEDKKSSMLMVGDRKMDIYGAAVNSIKSVGVRYGFSVGSELEDAGADYVVPTVAALRELLLSL